MSCRSGLAPPPGLLPMEQKLSNALPHAHYSEKPVHGQKGNAASPVIVWTLCLCGRQIRCQQRPEKVSIREISCSQPWHKPEREQRARHHPAPNLNPRSRRTAWGCIVWLGEVARQHENYRYSSGGSVQSKICSVCRWKFMLKKGAEWVRKPVEVWAEAGCGLLCISSGIFFFACVSSLAPALARISVLYIIRLFHFLSLSLPFIQNGDKPDGSIFGIFLLMLNFFFWHHKAIDLLGKEIKHALTWSYRKRIHNEMVEGIELLLPSYQIITFLLTEICQHLHFLGFIALFIRLCLHSALWSIQGTSYFVLSLMLLQLSTSLLWFLKMLEDRRLPLYLRLVQSVDSGDSFRTS